MAFLNRTY